MFGSIDVDQKSMEFLSKLDEYIRVYLDVLVDKFVECFGQYAEKVTQMQQMGKKEAVAFIHFSVLRTNILAKKHILRIDAYNAEWYSDRAECSGEYETGEVFQWLDRFESVLETARKKSGGQLLLSDVQSLVFEESNKYLLFVTEIIRAGMKKAVETESYKKMKRYEVFAVYVGGYQDQSNIVYKEDTTAKDAKAVKRRLQAKRQNVYAYEICDNLDLSEGNYEDIKLMFSSFSVSDLTGSSFRKCTMVGNGFQHAILKDVNLEQIDAFDIDFSGAMLENVDFRGAKLRRLSFAGAQLINVTFEGALLTENLNFEGARLTDTVIPGKQVSR